MCPFVYSGNENSENGLNSLFLENKDYLPFSFVQLGIVFVHSGRCFCTFTLDFVQMPNGFCTVGLSNCTVGFLVRLVQVYVHLVSFLVHLATHNVHMPCYLVQMGVKT